MIARRSAIGDLVREIQALPAATEGMRRMSAEECGLEHLFVPGIYARALSIPAKRIVVGKIHLRDHLSFGWGDVSVYSPAEGLQRLTGHWWMASKAGIQRAVYTHADTFWCAVHPNVDDSTDFAELEQRFVTTDISSIDPALIEQQLRGALE